MSRRRFAVLLVALVAVNAFFWVAQGSFALPRAMIDRFFGPRMIRAEVILQAPGGAVNDFRLDRGVITAVTPGSIDLRERDGSTVTIFLSNGKGGSRRGNDPPFFRPGHGFPTLGGGN